MIKRILPTSLFLAIALAAFVAAGCGDDTQTSNADKAAKQAQEELKNPPTIADVATPTVKVVKVTPGPGEGDLKKKPVIPAQTGADPTVLIAQDLVVGTGATAKTGDTVSVNYVGVLRKGGKEFDSSWKRKQPFDFALGNGSVIAGWDNGVVGMKVGGRRRLIIPADQAYGATGQPPTIPANAALVFDVDLLKVTPAKS